MDKNQYNFCETNIILLPLISLKREREDVIERKWISIDGKESYIKIIGGETGVLQIFELDLLLALFSLNQKNGNGKFNKTKNIVFTYQDLAKEIGYSDYSGKVKLLIEKSLKRLNEITIYSDNTFYNSNTNNYMNKYTNGCSFRLFNNYITYAEPRCSKVLIELDNFFLTNVKNGYYSNYNYEKYKKLKLSVSKRLYLIINALKINKSKYLTYQTLADYIGLDYSKSEKRYAVDLINRSMQELVEENIIKGFEKIRGKGVNIFFEDYVSGNIVEELNKLKISWEELTWLTQNTSKEYLIGVLKYINYKQTVKKEKIKNIKKYFLSAFNFYNEKDFKK